MGLTDARHDGRGVTEKCCESCGIAFDWSVNDRVIRVECPSCRSMYREQVLIGEDLALRAKIIAESMFLHPTIIIVDFGVCRCGKARPKLETTTDGHWRVSCYGCMMSTFESDKAETVIEIWQHNYGKEK